MRCSGGVFRAGGGAAVYDGCCQLPAGGLLYGERVGPVFACVCLLLFVFVFVSMSVWFVRVFVWLIGMCLLSTVRSVVQVALVCVVAISSQLPSSVYRHSPLSVYELELLLSLLCVCL